MMVVVGLAIGICVVLLIGAVYNHVRNKDDFVVYTEIADALNDEIKDLRKQVEDLKRTQYPQDKV